MAGDKEKRVTKSDIVAAAEASARAKEKAAAAQDEAAAVQNTEDRLLLRFEQQRPLTSAQRRALVLCHEGVDANQLGPSTRHVLRNRRFIKLTSGERTEGQALSYRGVYVITDLGRAKLEEA